MTDIPPVTDAEIEIVSDFISRFREYSPTQAISAATVALGLPALGQHKRIGLVLKEMEERGLLVFSHHIHGRGVFEDTAAYMEVAHAA